MLAFGNIHCYADDNTIFEDYFGPPTAKVANIGDKRQEFVTELDLDLSHFTQRANENLVKFNAMQIQLCAISTKKSPFLPLPKFQNTELPLQDKLDILGMVIVGI